MAKKKADPEVGAELGEVSEGSTTEGAQETSAEIIADRVAQMEKVLAEGESTHVDGRRHIHFPESMVELLRQCVQDIKATTQPEVETP